ncbi:MAG: aminomethyltransferase family protein [Deltaproteobacteria bacterium]|nr:aminomethyltransferase family protein [Deltaproteobacteria bacterium]
MTLQDSFAVAPTFVEVDGLSVPQRFGELGEEVQAIRRSVGLSARLDVACLRLSGHDAWEVLGRVCPANLFLRDAQLRHTLLLDESGKPIADWYVGNDDDAFLLLSEGLPVKQLCEHLAAQAPAGAAYELTDLSETHQLLGLDGPYAWEVLAALEGPDVAGFPFLSFYHPSEQTTYLRAGKTGEYGYGLLVPQEQAPALWCALSEAGADMSLREVGLDALWHASFENWFFNIHREGRLPGLTPVELQLQWRLAGDDREWLGRVALRARTATHRAVALVGAAPLAAGAAITYRGRAIGEVLVAERSATLDLPIGMGLIELPYAYSGIGRFVAGEVPLRTVSPPFVNNLSLYVDPQRDVWATRDEVVYSGPRPTGIVAP